MNDNIQFEYVTERKVWDYETHRYIDRPEKTFLEVLDTYPHHYTGEPMCRIRQHYVDDSGHPYVDEKVVMQSIVLKLWEENRNDQSNS